MENKVGTGKAYASKKSEKERPESDFYSTPVSLTWELLKLPIIKNINTVLEPACGGNAISDELIKADKIVVSTDIRTGTDFLNTNKFDINFDAVITNPPFSLFDKFVTHAKEVAPIVIMIAKTNFFGAYQRNVNGIWHDLSHVYIFNRQVDYRSPYRDDGLFHVGNLITGWFVWQKEWSDTHGEVWETSIIDVQKYATLGQIKEIIND
jgi:hypothetical protein